MDLTNSSIESEKIPAREIAPALKKNRLVSSAAPFFLVGAGLSIIAWAFAGENFSRDESFFSAEICLPWATALALIAAGVSINTKWRNFAFWAGAGAIGQAASLQMIEAGRLIHFQHYKTFPALFENLLPVALLGLQAVLVASGIGRQFGEIRRAIDSNFNKRRLIPVAIFMILAGAAVTPNILVYATSLLFAAVVQFVGLANIILLARAVPAEAVERIRQKIEILLGSENTKKTGIDRIAASAAVWVFLLAAALSYFIYERHPHVPDEVQYLFQARYMAAGQVSVPAPQVPEAFSMYMLPEDEARWFSLFPPGWAALLAVGVKLNAAWLVNPMLAGICILLAYSFFRRLYSPRFARVAVLLLSFSPWFVFMAMSFISHVFTLAAALAAAVFLQKAFENGKKRYILAAGAAIGVVSLIRPLDGLIVAVLLGVWSLFEFENWRKRLINYAVLIFGTVSTAALVLPYNRAVTGSFLLSPMDFYYTKYFWPGVMSLGFGANRGISWELDAFPGHSFLEASINAALNIFSLNTELFGWATGSLILAGFFISNGKFQKKDLALIAVIAFVIGCYSLYWYHGGPDFGARYWFLTIIPLVALSVRGIELLSSKTDETSGTSLNPRVISAVAILCALTFFNYLPWRALDKYFHYLEMQPGIRQLARENDFGKSLVLIRGAEHPDFQSAWVYNSLDPADDAPVYAHDKSPEIRARLLEVYRDRPIWIVEGPTITGGNYRIVGKLLKDEKLP